MDTAKLTAELVALRTRIVDTFEAQPFMDPALSLRPSGQWKISLYREYQTPKQGGYDLGIVKGETVEEVLASAWHLLENLPDQNTLKQREWQKKLANVIDEGREIDVPEEVLSPLRAGAQAMTKNLLTKEVV